MTLPRQATGLVLPGLVSLALVLVFLLFAGCTATTPSPAPGTTPAVTAPAVPSYMVHVAGNNRGVVLLVGRVTCPWCMKTKELLANMSVDYYWIDLNTLDEANTTTVMQAIRVCGQTSSVPILVIDGQKCIIGYQEAQIREALG
jgi:glutaredoxin-like protein NrdH